MRTQTRLPLTARLQVVCAAAALGVSFGAPLPGYSDRTLAQGTAAAPQKPDDTRFTVVTIVPPGELDEPMTFAVAKDGRVFINERRTGDIKVYDPATNSTQRVGTIPINHQYTSASGAPREAEEGFVGLTLDPKFEENHWAYILFADRDVAKHVLARIQMQDATVNGVRQTRIVPNSYVMMLEYAVQREECCHTGGGMTWDAAGNLYITVGNNTSNSPGSQTDERPGRLPWDDQRGAANSNDLRGKILRIHPEPDGRYTIPAGNLFAVGTPNTRPEIYTMGHRNAWRVSVDSKTGYVYWGEVGPDNQVDNPDVGPRGYDEFNQAKRPGFFGWPYFVGENRAFPFRDYVNDRLLGPKDVTKPTNTSLNNTGIKELPPAQPAMISYPSTVSEQFPEVGTGGRCAAGGPVYRRADFAANAPRPWPSYYEGKWLITDCSRAWILAVTLDSNSDYVSMERFLPGFRAAEPMDMKFGPEGDLYVLDYGSTWFAKSEDSRLVRIHYTAGNRTPKAVADADTTGGAAPLQVVLSGAGSRDYDGDALQYEWTVRSTTAAGAPRQLRGSSARLTLDRPGTYTATLRVTDPGGEHDSASIDLVVGNEPPAVAVTVSTPNKSFYTPGTPISYAVAVTDKEDGRPAADQVALSIDYVPEGFNADALKLGRVKVDATTRFAVAKALVANSDCVLCHNPSVRMRGPSMAELATKYKPDQATMNMLIAKVRNGGSGVWGPEVMPAHPQTLPTEARTIIEYFLSVGRNDTALATAPLEGTYVQPSSDLDSGRGSVIINAAYTDTGSSVAPWLTTQRVLVLRSPQLDPARADVKSGVDVAGGRGQASGVIAKANGYVGFTKVDLTGIKRLDIGTAGGGRGGAAVGGVIEVRAGSPTGELLGQSVFAPPAATPGGGRAAGPGGAGAAPVAEAGGALPTAAAGGRGATGGGGRGVGGATGAAAALGFPPATGPAAEAAAAPVGRGGAAGRGAGAGGAGGIQPGVSVAGAPGAGTTAAPGGTLAAGADVPGGGRGAGGRGGGGRGAGASPPAVAIDLKPSTGTRDIYVVFKNPTATPVQALMTVTSITFVQ